MMSDVWQKFDRDPSEQRCILLINVCLDFLKVFQLQVPCCLSGEDVSQ